MKRQRHPNMLYAIARVLLAAAFSIGVVFAAQAQNIQFTQGSIGSSLDNTLQIPIANYPGRGINLPVTLYYSSKVWQIKYKSTIYNPYEVANSEPMAESKYAQYSASGWTSSLGIPVLEWIEPNVVYNYQGKPVCLDCRATPFSPDNYWKVSRLYIHMPDGSTHELRRDDQPYTGPANNSGTYYAVDNSRLRYDTAAATLYLGDGSRYVWGDNNVQFRDRNGNTLNYTPSTGEWKDTLNRPIFQPPLVASPGPHEYFLPGVGGTPMRYVFHWASLSAALEPDPQTGEMPELAYAGDYYENGPATYSNPPQQLPGPHLFQTGGTGEGYNSYVITQPSLFNPAVLSEIELPNGLKYRFTYNEYGELAKIVYPTGAFEQFKYGQLVSLGAVTAPYSQANRGVISRWVSADGSGADRVRWQYGINYEWQTDKAHSWTIAPNNLYTERYLYKAPPTSQYSNLNYPKFGFVDPRNGTVYDERVYEFQNGPMLRRSLTDWTYSSRNVSVHFNGQTTVAPAMRNARPVKEVSLILDTGGDALAKTVTHAYDINYQFSTGLDRTLTTESYFASVIQSTAETGEIGLIPSGNPASRVETTYMQDPAYRQDRNILGLVTKVVLKDANQQPVSRTNTFYDETGQFPLVTYADLAGDQGYNDPGIGTVRGNPTTVHRYIDANADEDNAEAYLKTHAQFDQCGNVVNTWNERATAPFTDANASSRNEYSAAYSHAYLTRTTSAVPDPSGTHGSLAPFTTSSMFDRDTGLVLMITDINGQTTQFSYADDQGTPDKLNRLRKVTRPDGSWTKYSFGEEVGNLFTMTETQQDATRTVKSYQYADPMGRASRSFASEGGDSYIASDTIYDSMGRVWKVSNPYRTTTLNGVASPSHTNDWTTSTYDALSRVDYVTLPDSSIVDTDYEGIYTTVTDQAGKQRRQKTDALGRIVRVDEPNTNGDLGLVDTPTQPTFYEYNTQGNLIHILQGANTATPQHRYFKFDALGRLTYERQVEQAGTHTASDPLTGNSAWSRRLVYDETIEGVSYKGLLTSAFDARNIQTEFRYDNLNRIWQVSYSDGTPTVTNNYDQTRPDVFNRGHLTEALTAAVGSIPATSQIYNFDLMGRVANNTQTVGSNSYTMMYGYNLGGALTTQTYPSGRVVSYQFDAAARLSAVSSGTTVYANGFDYSTTQGLLKSVALGNGAMERFEYNSRLQMKTISLTKTSDVLQKYEYKYGVVQPDGSVDETKNNGQIGRIESWIGAAKQWQQRFSYDSLGRLSSASEVRGDNGQPVWAVNYDFDVFGNRYQKQSRNPGNPFTQIWTEDADVNQSTNRFNSGVTYDNAGNVTVDSKFRNLAFQYDANNRQKQSSATDGSAAVVSVYDAGGQRVATQVNNQLMNVLVYDASGKLIAEYGSTPAEANGTQYVTADHQGSPRAITNNSGAVVSRHDYAPFGEDLPANIGLRTTGQGYSQPDAVRHKYAGMENDDATGMSHTLWRQYDSRSGRWTAPDPYGGSMTIAAPQSFNRYSYVENDPVNKIDPLGLALQDIGVEQTSDPAHARRLEQQSLRDHQIAINAQYAARHGGTVSYAGNRAVFMSPAASAGAGALGGATAGFAQRSTGYGRMVWGERVSKQIWCQEWLKVSGRKILPKGLPYRAGVEYDVLEADIVYSEEKVGEDASGDMTPQFGVYAGDDRGHLVSAALGGQFTPENTTSQMRGINRGKVAQFEKAIRERLTDNRDWTAHLRIDIIYNPPDCEGAKTRPREFYYRPTEFHYSVFYTNSKGETMREGRVDTRIYYNGPM